VTDAIVTLTQARAYLNDDSTDPAEDAELLDAIGAASDVVEGWVGPVIDRSVTEVVTPRCYGGPLYLTSPPVLTVDAIAGAYGSTVTLAPGDVYVEEGSGAIRLGASSAWPSTPFTVTYTAGRPTVPPVIRQAVLEVLGGLWAAQRGPSAPEAVLAGEDIGDTASGNLGLARYRARQLLADAGLTQAAIA
jgi:hypothetical protein